MENTEGLLLELEQFNREQIQDSDLPQNLENFIEHVAKTGTYIFPWPKIKKLYIQKLKNVFKNLNLKSTQSNTLEIDQLKERIIDRMSQFECAPFTIQRISELLLKPNNNYTKTEKFLRGLEKCVMVVTTIDPSGNKLFVDNVNALVNSERPISPTLSEEKMSTDQIETQSCIAVQIETNAVTSVESVQENQNDMVSESVSESTTITQTETVLELAQVEPKIDDQEEKIETDIQNETKTETETEIVTEIEKETEN